MGWHACEFCPREATATNRFENTSSGDVNLTFENGHKWVMPDMILHYVADHGWLPPKEFVDDVISGTLVRGGREQTRGMSMGEVLEGTRVGYLTGAFERGEVPETFVESLERRLKQAGMSNRVQTKRLPVYR